MARSIEFNTKINEQFGNNCDGIVFDCKSQNNNEMKQETEGKLW